MIRRALVFVLIAAVTLLGMPTPAKAMMTTEEERKLGKKTYNEIVHSIPMVTDPDVMRYINNLGKKLVQFLPDKRFDYHFYVADSDEMNAFAIPGGYIFFYRGMITTLDNEAELAGIMAHEMGHVWRRHIAKRMEKAAPVQALSMAGVIAGLLLGALAGAPQIGQALAMGSMAGNIQAQLSYSRQDESEADWAGYKIMTDAGYSGNEMAKTFNRMWKLEQQMGVNVPTYMRTHPQSPERMEAIENMARRDSRSGQGFDNSEFQMIKVRLIALYEAMDHAESNLKAMQRQNPKDPIPIYGLGLLEMRRRDYQKALDLFDKVLAAQPGTSWVQKEQGLCLVRLGKFREAQFVLDKALTQRPGDPAILFALGEAYMHSGDYSVAVHAFRRVLETIPDNVEARRMMGMALGRMGRHGEASYQLGMAFKTEGNMKTARYHFERAVRELNNDPNLKAEAQKELDEMDQQGEEKPEVPKLPGEE